MFHNGLGSEHEISFIVFEPGQIAERDSQTGDSGILTVDFL